MPKKNYGFAHIHAPASYTSQDLADGIEKRLDDLDAIWTAAFSKNKAIEGNGELTAKGKQIARAALQVEVKKQIKNWLAAQSNLTDQIEREMQPKRNRPDDVVGEMRQREIRDVLRKLDPTEVEGRYRVAAETGDEQFLSAIEESPVPFLFTTGLVEKIRFSRLERAFPEQAKKLGDLKIGKTNVISALRSGETDLKKHGLDVSADPLSEAA